MNFNYYYFTNQNGDLRDTTLEFFSNLVSITIQDFDVRELSHYVLNTARVHHYLGSNIQ